MRRIFIHIGVSIGALVLSTVAIGATDIAQNIGGGLMGAVFQSQGGSSPCGQGAALLNLGTRSICVDIYEASPASSCPKADPQSSLETTENLETISCTPHSTPDVLPWRFVSLTDAQQLCARVGKRLPTNEEWYKAVSGLTAQTCVVNERTSQPVHTGVRDCISPLGIHDMVGNVWEWVEGSVHDGRYEDRALPESGYVQAVDLNGVVSETSVEPARDFGEDYASIDATGVRGMLRGGFYNSQDDAGIFTLNAAVPLDFKTTGIGFRCVEDV